MPIHPTGPSHMATRSPRPSRASVRQCLTAQTPSDRDESPRLPSASKCHSVPTPGVTWPHGHMLTRLPSVRESPIAQPAQWWYGLHCLAFSGNCRYQPSSDGLPQPAPGLGALSVSGENPQMSLPPSVSQTQIEGGITTFHGRACETFLLAPQALTVSSHASAPHTPWRAASLSDPRNRGRYSLAGAVWC